MNYCKNLGLEIDVPIPLQSQKIDRCLIHFDLFDGLSAHQIINEINWNIRIGIHSGTVVSRVVEKKKFTFDTWGDTVNIANRLEKASGIYKINVSQRIAQY